MNTAQKTNLGLATVAILAIATVLAAAALGGKESKTATIALTTTTSTANPTGDPDGTQVPVTKNFSGSRPANTDGSWFSGLHKGQSDYAMTRLSCTELRQYLTLDLCAVASTSRGSFMLTASEGYWDPAETDADNVVSIPLYMDVYTFSSVGGPPRAIKDLEGVTTWNYEADSGANTIQLYRGKLDADELLVLLDTGGEQDTNFETVHIITMSPTGAPQVAATYSGDDIRLGIDKSKLIISFSRYGPPKGQECCPDYATIMQLVPGPTGWTETFSSMSQTDALLDGMTPLSLIDKYVFPSKSVESTSN